MATCPGGRKTGDQVMLVAGPAHDGVQHMKKMAFVVLVLMLSACGTSRYVPPTKTYKQPVTTITVNVPRGELWRKLITKLNQKSYIINSLEKDSGFLNFSYNGDPEPHVDCGTVFYTVILASGSTDYTFRGSQKQADYAIHRPPRLDRMHRVMTLEGRATIILQRLTEKTTSVSLNTRYTLTRSITATGINDRTRFRKVDTTFNMGESTTLPGSPDPLQCVPTGQLERDILNLVKN